MNCGVVIKYSMGGEVGSAKQFQKFTPIWTWMSAVFPGQFQTQ